MAEQNGGNLKHRVSMLEQAGKELEDAMLVHAILEAKAAHRIKEHAEAIASHEDWLIHFQAKLGALTDIVMRREGGPEAVV